jgi:AbrB family looped-hinge helix DNA binding protein
MTTKVSSKGQVVLPAALRRQLDVRAGEEFEISVESAHGESKIVMSRRVSKRPKMKIIVDPVTGLPALKGPPGMPKLTSAMVKEMLADFP